MKDNLDAPNKHGTANKSPRALGSEGSLVLHDATAGHHPVRSIPLAFKSYLGIHCSQAYKLVLLPIL